MKLENIAEIRTGLVLSRKKAKSSPEKIYKILTLKSFEEHGEININELEEFESSELLSPLYLTKKGDVIIRLSSPYTAVYIEENLEGVVIPSLFSVIRLKNNKDILPEFLALYLNSDYGKRHINKFAVGSAISTISTNFLKSFIVKEFSKDIQTRMVEINKLHIREKKLLKNLIEEKETLNKSIINSIIN
ncbi:restriction endonuclease subunit S [Tepidibacter formicigenes]|uniref:Type I restriction modification DNA specificity domain-containing protein n=1 Tax=Tepidibacter formicigenes DSM 15518 TaxID=1123349 RepID=A0A1M6JNB5_9FIRM|nr:restriction endonuclease subunit S [Tepidibacter formicigenes]SHJ48134.1 Type I restriction modification DNA specificity domain-containing protein [Tepidibacter formicigenes DSM 15518]